MKQTMLKKTKLLALLGVLSVFSINCDPDDRRPIEDNAAEALLEAFGSSCPTKGGWTEQALKQNEGIIDAIKSIQESDKCKQFNGQLTKIASFSDEMKRYSVDEALVDYKGNQNDLQDLLLTTMGFVTGDTLKDGIASILSSKSMGLDTNGLGSLKGIQNLLVGKQRELSLTGAEFEDQFKETKKARLERMTKSYEASVGAMLNNIGDLQSCLAQSPVAAAQIATQLMASRASLSSVGASKALQVAAQLFNVGLSLRSNENKYNLEAFKARAATMPMALGCAMEAMSELYCQAEDERQLLLLQAENYQNAEEFVQNQWRGIDLLGRRMPVLLAWLYDVRAGVPPGDDFDANRQNSAWDRYYLVEKTARTITGRIKRSILNYTDNVTEELLTSTIVDIAQTIDGSDRGPFAMLSTDENILACFLVQGHTEGKRCPKVEAQDFKINTYVQNKLLVGGAANMSLSTVLENWQKMANVALGYTLKELSTMINVYPLGIRAKASKPVSGNLSPEQIIEQIGEFARQMKENYEAHPELGPNENLFRVLEDLETMASQTLHELHDQKLSDSDFLVGVNARFKLYQGPFFFSQLMRDVVDWDMNTRMKLGEFSQNIEEILRAAGGEIKNRITSAGDNNVDQAIRDVEQAQSLIQENLEIFHRIFGESIARGLQVFADNVESSGEKTAAKNGSTAFRPNYSNSQNLAQYCILALTTNPDDTEHRQALSQPISSSAGEQYERWKKWAVNEGKSIHNAPKGQLPAPCLSAALFSSYHTKENPMYISFADMLKDVNGHMPLGGKKAETIREKPYAQNVCSLHRFFRKSRAFEALMKSKM